MRHKMKYLDSEQVIRVGDKVVYAGSPGVIVFVIDDDSYSDGYRWDLHPLKNDAFPQRTDSVNSLREFRMSPLLPHSKT